MTAPTDEIPSTTPRTVGVVLYDGFELLDVFGPLEVFGMAGFDLVLIGDSGADVASAQGPRSVLDATFEDIRSSQAPAFDVTLLPGGRGSRDEVENPVMLQFLRDLHPNARLTTTVCTGSAILAAAGLLEGRRATSNKRAWQWVTTHGADVEWVPEARWVEDDDTARGDIWTSSGVAAGIDMALAVVARLLGPETATKVADGAEYEWHRDASWDPFAAKNGLA